MNDDVDLDLWERSAQMKIVEPCPMSRWSTSKYEMLCGCMDSISRSLSLSLSFATLFVRLAPKRHRQAPLDRSIDQSSEQP